MGVRRSEGLITQESVPAARLKRLYDGEAPSSTEKLFARSDRSTLVTRWDRTGEVISRYGSPFFQITYP